VTATAIVVGGGPGGLMAAETLAVAGVRVTVVEHMPSVGRKLLLAGRSGLNLTHSEPTEELLARFGPRRDRLEAAIRSFDATALRSWSAGLGEPTFVGTSGRVFPRSLRATPLLRAWLARLRDLGVVFETRTRWLGWTDDGSLLRFGRADGSEWEAEPDVTVLALGGASWPRVGSDGGWVPLLRGRGVTVNDLRPANCGVVVEWSPDFVQRHAGHPVKNVAITVGQRTARGDVVVTDHGMEGGPIYALTAAIREAIDAGGSAMLSFDLHPDLLVDQLVQRLDRRRPKDSLSSVLKRSVGLSPTAVTWLREVNAAPLPTDSRTLAALLKAAPMVVHHTAGIDRAISSAGGVDFDEVDEQFMLRRMPGTFVVGEMLDWEAPTGGYLLQATFSTAVAAANGALQRLAR
jgi:uncharacterized flavoprotein (TIGR03862 family)